MNKICEDAVAGGLIPAHGEPGKAIVRRVLKKAGSGVPVDSLWAIRRTRADDEAVRQDPARGGGAARVALL